MYILFCSKTHERFVFGISFCQKNEILCRRFAEIRYLTFILEYLILRYFFEIRNLFTSLRSSLSISYLKKSSVYLSRIYFTWILLYTRYIINCTYLFTYIYNLYILSLRWIKLYIVSLTYQRILFWYLNISFS